MRRSCILRVESLEDRSLPSIGLVLPAQDPLLPHLSKSPTLKASTAAANGDQNPYGAAFVPAGAAGGKLHVGDLLVSDFNNATGQGKSPGGNVQGTGTSIVDISPSGKTTTFFQGKPPLGLTTALGVLPGGFVLVGSVPSTTNAKGGTVAHQGTLLMLDHNGHVVKVLKDGNLLDGPWDLVVNAQGNQAQVFVANVLSGTITRIDMVLPAKGTPIVQGMTQIASGYATGTDKAALIVGPTGLAYDPNADILYVASTKDNQIFAVSDAASRDNDEGKGDSVVSDPTLHGPLALVLAPNGDLIAANGDAPSVSPPAKGQQNELVEYTTDGSFVAAFRLDRGAPGAAFGLALEQIGQTVHFAAVNDNANDVEIWKLTVV